MAVIHSSAEMLSWCTILFDYSSFTFYIRNADNSYIIIIQFHMNTAI